MHRRVFVHLQMLIVCLLVYFNCLDANRRAQLFIGGMFPLSPNSVGLNGSELLSTCELAVEMVNNRSDVLPNYELNLFYNDTKVNITN